MQRTLLGLDLRVGFFACLRGLSHEIVITPSEQIGREEVSFEVVECALISVAPTSEPDVCMLSQKQAWRCVLCRKTVLRGRLACDLSNSLQQG